MWATLMILVVLIPVFVAYGLRYLTWSFGAGARLTSPDGSVDAVLYEVIGGGGAVGGFSALRVSLVSADSTFDPRDFVVSVTSAYDGCLWWKDSGHLVFRVPATAFYQGGTREYSDEHGRVIHVTRVRTEMGASLVPLRSGEICVQYFAFHAPAYPLWRQTWPLERKFSARTPQAAETTR